MEFTHGGVAARLPEGFLKLPLSAFYLLWRAALHVHVPIIAEHTHVLYTHAVNKLV